MSRIKADLLLFLVALIWGGAFISQKDAFSHIGPCTFIAARFLISAILVLPFAVREWRIKRPAQKIRQNARNIFFLCASFTAGVILQQSGIGHTSVTNAGFLTGLYVIFVPLICLFVYRQKLSALIFPAALLSVAGTWFLAGGKLESFSIGDLLTIFCALAFGFQVSMVGRISQKTDAPLCLSFTQYASVMLVAMGWAIAMEHPALDDILKTTWPILYAGVLSGGIAYTLQVIAQQYAPASDAAIIMSGESVFAALGAAWLLGERLTGLQYAGCGLIMLAIVLAEVVPFFFKKET